jgi:hypothetical protein
MYFLKPFEISGLKRIVEPNYDQEKKIGHFLVVYEETLDKFLPCQSTALDLQQS